MLAFPCAFVPGIIEGRLTGRIASTMDEAVRGSAGAGVDRKAIRRRFGTLPPIRMTKDYLLLYRLMVRKTHQMFRSAAGAAAHASSLDPVKDTVTPVTVVHRSSLIG